MLKNDCSKTTCCTDPATKDYRKKRNQKDTSENNEEVSYIEGLTFRDPETNQEFKLRATRIFVMLLELSVKLIRKLIYVSSDIQKELILQNKKILIMLKHYYTRDCNFFTTLILLIIYIIYNQKN